jgi:peptidyl-prolyl cis-trans isomerase SurA
MRIVAQFALLLAVLACASGQVVDRMVAVVNKQVILQSELEEAERIDFLLQGKPLDEFTSSEMEAALDRFIDQALLRQQIVDGSLVEPVAEEIATRIRDLRSQIPGGAEEQTWKAMLDAYAVTEQDLQMHIASELRILKFVDMRFRTLARVDRGTILNYYNQTLLPGLRKQGAPEPPLSQVSDKIQQILTEQRINELLNSWLQALRSQAQIEKITSDAQLAAGAKP